MVSYKLDYVNSEYASHYRDALEYLLGTVFPHEADWRYDSNDENTIHIQPVYCSKIEAILNLFIDLDMLENYIKL